MKFRVIHRTEYNYSEPVSLCHNEARLRPRSIGQQICDVSEIEIEPAPAAMSERQDIFGNHVAYFSIQEPHQRLVVTATSEVERDRSTLERSSAVAWEDASRASREGNDAESRAVAHFLLDSPSVATSRELAEYAAPSFSPGRPVIEAAFDLCARIHRDFEFDPARTTVATPLSEVLAHRAGVCQDFAHLAIGCLRSLALPARYVSGYLETLPPPGKPRLVGADASHAWLALYALGAGWVELDPTNDQMPDERYVTIGWGRDYSDVAPFKGVIFGGGTHTLDVGVDMLRID